MTIRLYTGTFEGNYYGLYFENILCVCHFPTSYPKSTKTQGKITKNIYIVLVTIFDKSENLPKIVFTRASEVIITGSILRIFYVNVITPHITLNLH